MKFAAVAAFVLLAGAGPFAQTHHYSAPPPPPPSPFAAGPGTYAPHYDRPSTNQHRRGYSVATPFYIGAPVETSKPAAQAPEPTRAPEPPKAAPAPEPVPAPEPPRMAAAHGPDIFYVIPGCYAGNRPPIPERLPKGCDPEKLRTTPIR